MGSEAVVRKRVVFTSEQRGKLEEALFALGSSPERPGGDNDAWAVFYDNSAMALTGRDWWLCEKEGSWQLRVPRLKPSGAAGLTKSGYEELTDIEAILERVGLVQHAEALRKGLVNNVEKLLGQAGVTPFARIYSEVCFYRLSEKGDPEGECSKETDYRGLALVLHQL